ncbi:L-2-hydroxyglutarate oxidase [Mycolicibacterium aichiense]|uniref:Hydroxyglutarate oxidase n=1 Tax=Mycolicibacterium aichiense TaxID=1799 RepID=A0AAD1HQX8_9MYCO|nr:L-2-hydroxyglutarate oxidase [Mycolicibacterium aichiense]MCV7020385.1 L-2-hydroxyglutarate oxidase [Mycolicibacterium aichiense]BBX07896.1 hydroxyglutarate oxidase [Mycolicibacterium aichiense]STZ81706.1 FAD dependent oxidoreductase [Mycolicibacterium aichiense]
MTRPEHDLVVVGAGIVGLAVAREWMSRRPQDSVAVVEREDGPARHQTGHNSGVVHGGIYYPPGSLKARLCVDGARMMYEYCEHNAISHERCGKLIVAVSADELGRLDDLQERGIANAVPGLRRVGAREIAEIEPNAVGLQALHAPNTGIVDYPAVARTLAAELTAAGVSIRFGTEVTGIEGADNPTVHTTGGPLRAHTVIACAGLWADRLARRAGAPRDPQIVPFRGAYLGLTPTESPRLNGMIYPVPNPDLPFLGVHITKHITGDVTLGPTAMMVGARDAYSLRRLRIRDSWETLAWPGTWRVARRYWRVGLDEIRMAASRRAFVTAAARYMPGLTLADLDGSSHAGVRAQAVGRDGSLVDDFVISRDGHISHVRNAPSPAATSAFALAGELVDRVTG